MSPDRLMRLFRLTCASHAMYISLLQVPGLGDTEVICPTFLCVEINFISMTTKRVW